MNLIPEFKIGLLNGWIGVIPLLLLGWVFMIANKKAGKRAVDTSWYTKKDKLILRICMPLYYSVIFYSIVVQLKIGTILFYVGLAIYMLAFVPLIISYFNYATAPLDEPIVKGVYRISRNPMYFFTALGVLGVSIACASWLMILLLILYCVPQHFGVLGEERYCLEKYGDEYREYKKKAARYFLFF